MGLVLTGPGHDGSERIWGEVESGVFLRNCSRLSSVQNPATKGLLLDSVLWRMLKRTAKVPALGRKLDDPVEEIQVHPAEGSVYAISLDDAIKYGKYVKVKGGSRWEIPIEFWTVTDRLGNQTPGRRIVPGAPTKVSTGSPILSLEELEHVVHGLRQEEAFVFDVETYGPNRVDPRRNDVLWISLASTGFCRTVNLSYQYPDGPPCLPGLETWEVLEPLLFSDARKVGHNVKFDLMSVAKYYDALPPPPYGDTLTVAHLLDENRTSKRLKDLITKTYDFSYESLAKKAGMETYPFVEAALYSYLDAKYTWLLWQRWFPEIEAEGLTNVFDLEMDTIGVVCGMEMQGVPVDEARMRRMDVDLTGQIDDLEKHIFSMVSAKVGKPYPFDLNSGPQKGKVIYEVLGHTPRDFTEKTGRPSTRDESLRAYRGDPIVSRMMDHADLKKIHSTYIEGQLHWVVDGRIHCQFNACGTVTGRFSSSEPNLQNLPARDDPDALGTGDKIRSLFVAPAGWMMVGADYSQVEYRVLGHYSQEPVLLEGYAQGWDAHTLTAALFFKTTPDKVTALERQMGKNLNFAMVYGAGPDKLSQMSGIGVTEAKKILADLPERLPRVEALRTEVIRTARRRRPPHVRTLYGRKRRLPALLSNDFKVRGRAERQAFNSLIQGSSADLIKAAMVTLDAALVTADLDAYLALTVHDELITLCPEAEVEQVVPLVKQSMEGVYPALRVPLVAEVKVGHSWAETK